MACFIAKMDPSMPSPGKLKADIDRVASQSSQPPVTAQERNAVVTGLTDRSELSKEILNFCGALPIYNTKISENPIKDENGTLTLTQKPARHLRRNLPSGQYASCLMSSGSSPLQYVINGGCLGTPKTWNLRCRLSRLSRSHFYYATCVPTGPPPTSIFQNPQYSCTYSHLFGNSLYSYCCDPICPCSPPIGRK